MIEIELPASWRATAIVIHDVTDPEAWLRADELEVARGFKHQKRCDEWMLSRVAAKELARRTGLCSDPRDFVVTRPLVSISHSGPYAGAAINAGIDIEVIREVSEKTSRHFLTESEATTMQHCTISHRLLHFWCAKEAAWKARGGEIALLRDVALKLIEEGERGVRFEGVQTYAIDDLIVAVTAIF